MMRLSFIVCEIATPPYRFGSISVTKRGPSNRLLFYPNTLLFQKSLHLNLSLDLGGSSCWKLTWGEGRGGMGTSNS